MLLIVIVMVLANWQINREMLADREVPLTDALSTYSSKLEGDTIKSRAMGAAILFGLENLNAKKLALGKLPPDAPQVLSSLTLLSKLYFKEAAYLVNQHGVIASSTNQGGTSGIGLDLSDRSFIKTAMTGIPNIYPSVDSITNSRCIFLAAPIRAEQNDGSKVIGVVVLKAEADKVDALLESWTGGPAMLLSPQGLVFAASRKSLIFHIAADANKESIDRVLQTPQFGSLFNQTPPPSLPFTLDKPETNIDGVTHIVRSRSLLWKDSDGNWTLVLLDKRDPWWEQWSVLTGAGLAGLVSTLALFWLYTMARDAVSRQINHRELSIAAVTFESNEGIMIVDSNKVILKVNHAFTKITGYTSEEAVGNTPAMFTSGRQDKEFYRHMWDAIELESNWCGEIWNKKKSGEIYLAWLTITVVKNEDGKIANYIATYTDITERQRLQAETVTLFRRNQALMKNAIDGIHILDIQGNIMEANDSFCRMLGYTQEEIIQLNVADWDKNWSDDELRERMKQLTLDGVSSTFETTHCRKDGTLIDIEISCTGVEIDGQHYLFASSRDITSRKLAENMLRVAAATFETNEAIMITDTHANIIRVNQAFQDITGYSSEEVLGKNPSILSSGVQDKAFYVAMWKQLLDNGSWTGEIWDRRKSGQIYPKLLTITAIKNDRQQIVQYVGIFRDITERKKAEEEILLKSGTEHKRAEELTQQLGHLLKNSFNEIYIFDAHSLHFLLTSEGAEKNLGYSTEELKQFTPPDLCPSITKERFSQMLALLISGEQQSLFYETVLQRKNGTTYPVEVRLQFIKLDIPVFVFIIQDITEHKSAERQLRNLSMHLQTVREEEKANIAREIHDDLGSTLTALKMDINWLMDEMSVNKEAAPFLEHVESMSQLLDDAARVTRRVITDLRPTILDDLGLCAALEWQAGQFYKRTGIQSLFTCRTDDCEYELDKIQTINMFRIFQESLTNVARHSGASRVEVEFKYGDDEVVLVINDNGCGLPEGHIIAQNSFGMLGMRERAEQMGGTIKFYSPPNGGFSVTVLLPLLTDKQNWDKS